MKYLFLIFLGFTQSLFTLAQENCYSIQTKIENNQSIPKTNIKPISFDLNQKESITIPVYNENDFFTNNFSKKIIFEIKCDIKITKGIVLNSRNGIIINGNGHKIFQVGTPLNKIKRKGKWNTTTYTHEIYGDECFINSKGDVFYLSKTNIFQAKNWSFNDTTKIVQIELPSSWDKKVISKRDNVFINYSMWFIRQKDQVLSLENRILRFKCNNRNTPNEQFRSWTKAPYIFLENSEKDFNGVFINNQQIYYPAKLGELYKCDIKRLLTIIDNTTVFCKNLNFGFASDCIVKNYGNAYFENCTFSNSSSEGINSTNQLIVEKCNFNNLTKNAIFIQPRSKAKISNSTFTNIGKYGTNTACITSMGDAYISHNKFEDFNYSAMILGNISTIHQNELSTNLVEYNYLNWTESWSKEMLSYGLKDSGAIYIGTNNKQCVIRYNNINNFGGLGNNRSIFCDDGAYNLIIYGNIINNTQNDYDIDSRDCSKITYRKTPKGYHFNTNNFIGYNICTGSIKAEGNSVINNNKCQFINNIIIGDSIKNPKIKISNNHLLKNSQSIIFDKKGIINNNQYTPSTNKIKNILKNGIN